MSRRKGLANDSLDLLLDTICNTFGGVLFIAMLVIILANLSGTSAATVPPAPAAKQQLANAQAALTASQQELATLRRAAQEQAELTRLLDDPSLKALLVQSSSQQATLSAAATARASHLQDAAAAQTEANRVAEALAALDKSLAEARRQLAVVSQQLAAEKQLRTRTTTLPKLRATTKRQIAFLLTGGKLHAYLRAGSGGKIERAADETQEVASGGAVILEPIAGSGLAIDPAGDKSGAAFQQLVQKLAGFSPQQHFISISVWPDSFPHFAAIRQLLVERGFEYQLIPLAEGEKIKITTSPVSDKVM